MEKTFKGFARKELADGVVVGECMNGMLFRENTEYSVGGKVLVCGNGLHSCRIKKDVLKYYADNLFAETEASGDIDGKVAGEDSKIASSNIKIGKWLNMEEFCDTDELREEAIRRAPRSIRFFKEPTPKMKELFEEANRYIDEIAEKGVKEVIHRLETNYENDLSYVFCRFRGVDKITKAAAVEFQEVLAWAIENSDDDGTVHLGLAKFSEELAKYVADCAKKGMINKAYEKEMHDRVKEIFKPVHAIFHNEKQVEEFNKSLCKLFNKALKDCGRSRDPESFVHK